MPVKKFAISIPEDVMKEIDRAARARKTTRSGFIADVLRRAARARSDAEITRRFDELFAEERAIKAQRDGAKAWERVASEEGTEW